MRSIALSGPQQTLCTDKEALGALGVKPEVRVHQACWLGSLFLLRCPVAFVLHFRAKLCNRILTPQQSPVGRQTFPIPLFPSSEPSLVLSWSSSRCGCERPCQSQTKLCATLPSAASFELSFHAYMSLLLQHRQKTITSPGPTLPISRLPDVFPSSPPRRPALAQAKIH